MDILGFGFQQSIWFGTTWKIISSGRQDGDEVNQFDTCKNITYGIQLHAAYELLCGAASAASFQWRQWDI